MLSLYSFPFHNHQQQKKYPRYNQLFMTNHLIKRSHNHLLMAPVVFTCTHTVVHKSNPRKLNQRICLRLIWFDFFFFVTNTTTFKYINYHNWNECEIQLKTDAQMASLTDRLNDKCNKSLCSHLWHELANFDPVRDYLFYWYTNIWFNSSTIKMVKENFTFTLLKFKYTCGGVQITGLVRLDRQFKEVDKKNYSNFIGFFY